MLDIFGSKYEGPRKGPLSDKPEDFKDTVATLPAFQAHISPWQEYENFVEDKIWSPITDGGEGWMALFMYMARAALTSAQECLGREHMEALENSCNGCADQYIFDVLHGSGYIPEVALRRLLKRELPAKLHDRWTSSEINLFRKGLTKYGKKFDVIRAKFLPNRTTMDLVDFYYTWKRSHEAKGLVASRARRFLLRRTKSLNLIIGCPNALGVLTRARLAATEQEPPFDDLVDPKKRTSSRRISYRDTSTRKSRRRPVTI